MVWFTKTPLPPITKDVAMASLAIEEQAIMHSQHLDLIYSHSSTMYDIILHAPRSSKYPKNPNPGPPPVSHASMG
jgi:hypothetical protein